MKKSYLKIITKTINSIFLSWLIGAWILIKLLKSQKIEQNKRKESLRLSTPFSILKIILTVLQITKQITMIDRLLMKYFNASKVFQSKYINWLKEKSKK